MTDADLVLDGDEQALVERLVEMAALQAVIQPLIGAVVEQQAAQEGLFGFEIVRKGGGIAGRGHGRGGEDIEHDWAHKQGKRPTQSTEAGF